MFARMWAESYRRSVPVHYDGRTSSVGLPARSLRRDPDRSASIPKAEDHRKARELAPLRRNAMARHPWREWGNARAHERVRMPGGESRWSAERTFLGAAADRACVRAVPRSRFDHIARMHLHARQ